MKDHHPADHDEPGLSFAVDVFDEPDLFEGIDNQRVLELSRLGGQKGFSGLTNILRSTGIANRRILKDGVCVAELAERLCRKLERQCGWSLHEFDAILLCHSHTDPTACQRLAADLKNRLNLPLGRLEAFNYGCAGFLKLLQEGTLQLESCGHDAKVALLSIETPESWHDAADRLFCGIVSAGATACVLESGRGLPLSRVRADDFVIPPDRRPNPNPLFHKEEADVFCFRGNPCRKTVMRMNPEPVFVNGIELMLLELRSALSGIDDIASKRIVVAPHQPSGKLLKALVAAARMEFPRLEFLNNLRGYGNTISSSVPTLLSRLPEVLEANQLAPLQNGDRLILLAAGICMSEIADHMSAGHACLTWEQSRLNPCGETAMLAAHDNT